MTEANNYRETEDLQAHLQKVIHLLHKQKLVEGLVHMQEMPRHELSNPWCINRIWQNCKSYSIDSIPPTSPIFWKPYHWKIV